MVVEVLVEEVAEEEIFRAAEVVSDPCDALVHCAQKINANGGDILGRSRWLPTILWSTSSSVRYVAVR